jgi:hypothetical protein
MSLIRGCVASRQLWRGVVRGSEAPLVVGHQEAEVQSETGVAPDHSGKAMGCASGRGPRLGGAGLADLAQQPR